MILQAGLRQRGQAAAYFRSVHTKCQHATVDVRRLFPACLQPGVGLGGMAAVWFVSLLEFLPGFTALPFLP